MRNAGFPGRGGWRGRFRGCGYRVTAGRETVLQVLLNTKEHLSAEEIFFRAKKINPAVGLTTVYRTLEMLSTMGAVHKFDFGDKRARYEISDSSKGHHHHLVCTKCNKIIDYDDFIDEELQLLEQTQKKLSKKYDFSIENHLIQFYGKCSECSGSGG